MAKINNIIPGFLYGEISPRFQGRIDTPQYKTALATCANFIPGLFGGAFKRPGTKYVASLVDQTNTGRLIPFRFSDGDAFILEFTNNLIRFYTDQAQVVSGMSAYSIVSPYAIADVPNIDYDQSFDVVYLACNNYPPYKIQRINNTDWTITEVSFSEPPYLDIQDSYVNGSIVNNPLITLTPSGTTGSVTVTASANLFVSTDVGGAIRYQSGPDMSESITYAGNGAQTFFAIPFYPQTAANVAVNFILTSGALAAKTYTSGVPGTGQFTINTSGQVQTGDTATNSQLVQVLPANAGTGVWGWGTITAYTSATQVTVSVVNAFQGTNASLMWRMGAWSTTMNFPTKVLFHEQRLWWANSATQPATLWGSGIGDFEDYRPDNDLLTGITDDSSPCIFTLVTPSINWIASKQIMFAGCDDSLQSLQGSGGVAITATNIYVRKEVSVSCANIKPIVTSDEVVFVERFGKRVHAIAYFYLAGGYVNFELTEFSEHIGQPNAIDYIVYQEIPNKVIWAHRTDGSLASLTYNKMPYYEGRPKFIGWGNNHTIGGTTPLVESIACIPGNNYSELWMLVNRQIGGSTTRYVEVMQKDFNKDNIANAWYSDSGAEYNGSATSTIAGLTWLEGQTVSIWCQDAVTGIVGQHPNVIVSNSGVVTLMYNVTNAIVGLPYTSQFQTLKLEGGSTIGTSQGAQSRVQGIVVRFNETIGADAGLGNQAVNPFIFNAASQNILAGPSLFTGDLYMRDFPGDYDLGYYVYIQSALPGPCTILAVIVKAAITDN